MPESSYDCIVIGSGPGGYVAAIRAAQLGIKTAVIERDKVGGRCLNYACIPAKAVLRSADLLSEINEAGDYGLKVAGVEVDYAGVQARREKIVATLTSGVSGLFKKNDIELIEGDATLTAAGAVSVAGAGRSPPGRSSSPPGPSRARSQASPSPIASSGPSRPGRCPSCRLVWRSSARARPAPRSPPASRGSAATFSCSRRSTACSRPRTPTSQSSSSADSRNRASRSTRALPSPTCRATARRVTFSYGAESAEVDYLVIAAGRGADVEGLGLADAGVELDERGLVRVDGALRTSRAGVYAIGDLVPGPALAHKASDEGIIAAEDAAGLKTHPISYIDIPRATFCTPNVGSFGLTEAQAREQGYDVVVGKVPYGAVGGGIVYGDRSGMVKIVGESKYGELLGGAHRRLPRHRADPGARQRPRCSRAATPRSPASIHGHPTLSEAVMEARTRRRRLADPRLEAVLPAAAFYFDLASPDAYLAAERVLHVLPGPAEWQPVLAHDLGLEPSTHAGEESGVEPLEHVRSALAPAAAALARSLPFRQLARDARGDLREVDRTDRPLRPGRLPPGLRRRAQS